MVSLANSMGIYLEGRPFATGAVLDWMGSPGVEPGLHFFPHPLPEVHLLPFMKFLDGEASVGSLKMDDVLFHIKQDMTLVADRLIKVAQMYSVVSISVGWTVFGDSWIPIGEALQGEDTGPKKRPAWSYLPFEFFMDHLTMRLRKTGIADPEHEKANGLDITCFRCGHRNPRNVWSDEFDCRRCRHKLARTYNAAAWLALRG